MARLPDTAYSCKHHQHQCTQRQILSLAKSEAVSVMISSKTGREDQPLTYPASSFSSPHGIGRVRDQSNYCSQTYPASMGSMKSNARRRPPSQQAQRIMTPFQSYRTSGDCNGFNRVAALQGVSQSRDSLPQLPHLPCAQAKLESFFVNPSSLKGIQGGPFTTRKVDSSIRMLLFASLCFFHKFSYQSDAPPVPVLFPSLRRSILTSYPSHSRPQTHHWPT